MYVSIGDGGAGEQGTTSTRQDAAALWTRLGGKVLRIIARPAAHARREHGQPQRPYHIPNDNPFTGINERGRAGRDLRARSSQPHRISWDARPTRLFVNDIGLHTWEEVNIIQAGGNYGYSTIEGNQVLGTDNDTHAAIRCRRPFRAASDQRDDQRNDDAALPRDPIRPRLPGQPQPGGRLDHQRLRLPRQQHSLAATASTSLATSRPASSSGPTSTRCSRPTTAIPNTMAAIHQIDVCWDNPDERRRAKRFTRLGRSAAPCWVRCSRL